MGRQEQLERPELGMADRGHDHQARIRRYLKAVGTHSSPTNVATATFNRLMQVIGTDGKKPCMNYIMRHPPRCTIENCQRSHLRSAHTWTTQEEGHIRNEIGRKDAAARARAEAKGDSGKGKGGGDKGKGKDKGGKGKGRDIEGVAAKAKAKQKAKAKPHSSGATCAVFMSTGSCPQGADCIDMHEV